MNCVPVVDQNQIPLMPTYKRRAIKWVEAGKATPFYKKGVWCVRLNVEPSAREMQPIVVGVDPGSKKEGFTVKATHKTFLNLQADARDGIKEKLEVRRMMRRSRRQRKTPYRQCRHNRAAKQRLLPPSTKARWQWKLNIIKWLNGIFPITDIVVEDIKAVSRKDQRRWNKSFSPLQVGKAWFYDRVREIAHLHLIQGRQTAGLRKQLGLTKTKSKLINKFEAHCVDSWILANLIVGGHVKPDLVELVLVKPLVFDRRRLHMLQPTRGGQRRPQGGTRSLGFKRGSLVKHPKHGLVYVGGASKGRVSLHSTKDKRRLTQDAKPTDLRFRCFQSFLLTQ